VGIPISLPSYIGLCDMEEQKDRAEYSLDDLVGEGSHFKFKLQKWDSDESGLRALWLRWVDSLQSTLLHHIAVSSAPLPHAPVAISLGHRPSGVILSLFPTSCTNHFLHLARQHHGMYIILLKSYLLVAEC
jgi:hypothetical protein